MHSGRWAEEAHLFRPNLAPNMKMLSSARHRAVPQQQELLPGSHEFGWGGRRHEACLCVLVWCRLLTS
eukprot:6003561-Prymnesium_polylepis.1